MEQQTTPVFEKLGYLGFLTARILNIGCVVDHAWELELQQEIDTAFDQINAICPNEVWYAIKHKDI
jgi:hypothetical protein